MDILSKNNDLYYILFLLGMLLDFTLARDDDDVTSSKRLKYKPTYFIAAPTTIRPSEDFNVYVTIFHLQYSKLHVGAYVSKDGSEFTSNQQTFTYPGTKLLTLQLPESADRGNYSLTVYGKSNSRLNGGYVFYNETSIVLQAKHVSVFIQTDHILYGKKTNLRFRVIAVKPDLIPVSSGSMTIYVKDVNGMIVKRFLSQHLNNGFYEGETKLGHPKTYGWWSIEVHGWGQVYTERFYTNSWTGQPRGSTAEKCVANYLVWPFWTSLKPYFAYSPFAHYDNMLYRCNREWRKDPNKFNVNATIPPYIMDNEYGLEGVIMSNYSSGFPVRGNASVSVELEGNGTNAQIQHNITMFQGLTTFMIPMKTMAEAVGGRNNLIGTKIKATVSTYDWYAMEARFRPRVLKSEIYSSDVRMAFVGGRIRTFKPNQRLPIVLAFYHEDGSQYSNFNFRMVDIDVFVTKASGSKEHILLKKVIPDNGIIQTQYIPADDDIFISVRAALSGYKSSFGEMTAYRHQSRSSHILYITSSTVDPKANTYMVFTVKLSAYIPVIYYMVLSKSNILFQDSLTMKSRQTTFSLSLSRSMIPEAKIIVYGLLNDAEILADSLTFHVKGIQNNKFSVSINRGKDLMRDTVEMNIMSDPSTFVAITAWPYEQYKRGLHTFLSEHKVEADLRSYIMEKTPVLSHTYYSSEGRPETQYYNTPSYAIDPNTTFQLAGLKVFTDADLYRIPGYESCNHTLGYRSCHDSSCYTVDQECDGVRHCQDGADELLCETDDVKIKRPGSVDELYMEDFWFDSTEWGWKTSYTQPYGRTDMQVAVPFSPRTWLISGYSLSHTNGLAFQEHPARMASERSFYIILEQDSKAVKGEQLGMQVSVFNYWHQPIEAVIILVGSKQYKFVNVEQFGIVSSYSPRTTVGDVQTMVYLEPGEAKLIHFPILPVVLGKVTVTVVGESLIGRYQATHSIDIRLDGITNTYHTPYLVDLVNKGSVLIPDMWIPVPERFMLPEQREHLFVPGSQEAKVSVVGDIYGPGYFTRFPDVYNTWAYIYGNIEQYAFKLKHNMLTLKYLKLTNQLIDDTLETRLKDLASVYLSISPYMRSDGSVGMYRKAPKSDVWASAVVLDTLCALYVPEWEENLYIDMEVVGKIAAWIVSKQDKTTGGFMPSTHVYDMRMRSNLTDPGTGELLHLSITATVVIALQAAADIVAGEVASASHNTVQKGASYLAKHLHLIHSPFEMCVVTYALHVANHKDASDAFIMMNNMARRGEHVYWSPHEIPPNPVEIVNARLYQHPRTLPLIWSSQAVQATAYALLVTLRYNRFRDAQPIMMWLQTQRDADGGFISSVDTTTASLALLEYARRDTNRDLYNMAITIESTASPGWLNKVILNSNQLSTYSTFKVPTVYGAVRASAQGSGMALLQMTTKVNVEHPWQIRRPSVSSFDLWIDELHFSGRNFSHLYIRVCAKWLLTELYPTSGDVTLEVDVPTGFFVRKDILRSLRKKSRIDVMRTRWTKHRVLHYMEYLDAEGDCWEFLAERRYPVANTTIQQLIRIYDNKEPGLQNTTMYTTYGLFHLHICQTCGSFQCPYCPYYNSAPNILHPYTVTVVILICIMSLMYGCDYIKL